MVTESIVSAPPSSRRPRLPVAVATVAILAVLAVAAVWETSAHVLNRGGLQMSAPVAVGHTMYVDLGVYPASGAYSPTIDVLSLRLRVLANTAGATLTVHECTRGTGPAAGIGAVNDDWHPYCSAFPVVGKGPLRLDNRRYQTVLAITPRRPGVVRIDGADVRYRHLLRFGHQHVGGAITLTATPA